MRFDGFSLKMRCLPVLVCALAFPSNVFAQPAEQGSADAMGLPGAVLVSLPPIAPEEAERLTEGRVDYGDQNKGTTLAAKKQGTVKSALSVASVAPIPASVSELARSLKYDPVLIYEFIRNNIEYLPVWGVLKGSEGTLSDGQGTAFDIAQLTADLINADPSHSAVATLVRGRIKIPAETAGSWISLSDMNVCPLSNAFAAGGIPNTTFSLPGYPSCIGTPATITISHVWVKVAIGSNVYEIDPSFKTHTKTEPVVNLASVTGYDRNSFLAAACSGCNANPNIVTNLNRSNILNPANSQSYPKFARNLLSYMQNNSIHDINKIIGGYKIDPIYATTLPTSLPYTVVSRDADPFVIDGTWKASLLVNFNGISQLFSSDAIYGKRLTVTLNSGNFPQLNLDGVVVQTGTVAMPTGSSSTVNISICMPFSGVNCSVGSVDASGKASWCSNPPQYAVIRCIGSSIKSASGATYAIVNGWGPVGHNTVEKHKAAVLRAYNSGMAPSSEGALGEALTVQGLSYTEQTNIYMQLSEDGKRNGGYYYFSVGISGHTGLNGGPYIDWSGLNIFPGIDPALNSDGSYTRKTKLDNFLDSITQGSVLESTSVNQISGIPSLSTAKLLDINMSLASNNNIYDMRSCNDYNAYSGSLIAYAVSVKSMVQNMVCSQGYRVVLPQRGDLSDPSITASPKWIGVGFYGLSTSLGAYPSIISGGFAGGEAGERQSPTAFTGWATDNINDDIIVIGHRPGTEFSSPPGIAPVGGSGGSSGPVVKNNSKCSGLFSCGFWLIKRPFKLIADPVDQSTGAFIHEAADLSVGESGTPQEITFGRTYSSADISISPALGGGWQHSLDIWARSGSEELRPGGGYDAWDAAEMLAVKMVNRDLMSDPALPVVNLAVVAVGNRWLGDRLVNNSVNVSAGITATSFYRLADDSYNPGHYSNARLSGNSSAWIVKSADGAVLTFNPADNSGYAQINTVSNPSGIVTTFNYSNASQTVVSNNLGRRLDINWTGGKISSVTDSPLQGYAARTVNFTYSGNLLQQVTDARGGRTLYCYDGAGRMTAYYLPTEGSGTNCSASGAHIANVYDSLGRVKQQTDGVSHVTDLYLAGTRTEVVTHPGGGVADIRAVSYLDNFGNIIREVSPRTGLATLYSYDALSRLVRTDYPEGNAVEISYDIRSNPTRNCIIPKLAGAYPACNTGAGSSHIWTVTSYNEAAAVWNCVAINTCNSPASVTDPLGSVTSYTYKADGQIDTVTLPTPSGYSGAPKTVNSYSPTASLSGNINLLTQRTVTATAGAAPTIVTNFGYDTAANGLVLKTATLDPSGLNYTTTYGYDGYGNRTTVKGARTDVDDTVTMAYDSDRNPTAITYPSVGGSSPQTRFDYNANGWMTSSARKLGANWMVSCITFTLSGQVETRFGPYKRSSPTDCTFSGNSSVPKLSYGYDGADRLTMMTAAENAGDRITKLGLLPDNRVQTLTRAYGTAVAATETTAYSNNGLLSSVTDARGNVSAMVYDGFDRLQTQRYPLAGGGGASTTDVVAFAYDKRGAVAKRSIRGTSDVSASCVQCIGFIYDELGRLKQKTVPAVAANTGVQPNIAAITGYSVYYHYDPIGRLDQQGYSSGSPELTFAYDNASRVTSANQYGRTISYSYGTPAQGLARTLTWPSSVGSMLTCTDALGRISQIKESTDCSNATGRLALYGYDDLSRRISVARPSGANSSYSYEDTGTLDTLGHALVGGAAVNYGFNYNRALQIASRSTDNDQYAWTNHYNVTRSYSSNGLDQYGRIMEDTPGWDTRGNLAAYRGSSYGYDGENRLAVINLPNGAVSTAYDPAGRLRQIVANATTQFLYDGDQLIAEYNASGGALAARYVPGAGGNETMLAYDGSGTKNWYHEDAQGSVVAASNASGNAVTINQYGPYGEPGIVYQGRNQGRFRYTGQAIISEAGAVTGINQILYNYRARIYAPKLGRFLQTDPIGTQDDRNLYAYVGNDPINTVDPAGLFAETTGRAQMTQNQAEMAGAKIVITALRQAPPITLTLGADAYLGVGGSGSLGISFEVQTGQLRGVVSGGGGWGYGGGVGINFGTGERSQGAQTNTNFTYAQGLSGTLQVPLDLKGGNVSPPSGGGLGTGLPGIDGAAAGFGIKGGGWVNGSIDYTSPPTPSLWGN